MVYYSKYISIKFIKILYSKYISIRFIKASWYSGIVKWLRRTALTRISVGPNPTAAATLAILSSLLLKLPLSEKYLKF